MKKLLVLLCSFLMTLALVGCSKQSSGSKTAKIVDLSTVKGSTTELTSVFVNDLNRLDYLATNKQQNQTHSANFVDGLLENDNKGNFIPSLAESFEKNEDATVWTFHLRKGVKWMTADKEEYGEVKADDFVAALQHAVDVKSEMLIIVQNIISGLNDYVLGKIKFEEVGVKALDDYTVQYTLTDSVPYFHTMTTYAILYPVNRAFLESKGCPLGGDQSACAFGSTSADSILYNGAFILSTNDAKSKISYVKNPTYWDKDNVHFETVTYIYDDGSDAYSVMKGFESGQYAAASLNTAWADYKDYAEKFKDYITTSLPNENSFGIQFNYNRRNYNFTGKQSDEEKENTRQAILNKNFRLAVMSAFDPVAYGMVSATREVAEANIRNLNNVPTLVHTSDGTSYGKLVTDAYNKMTGKNFNLDDGHAAYYNPDAAKEYIAAAEKEGVKFPVRLDVIDISDQGEFYVNRALSLKKSIEENTGGKIIVDVQLQPQETVGAVCFDLTDPSTAADYDFNTFAGWGPDYVDPMTFAHTFMPGVGEYMKNIGLLATDGADDEIKTDEIVKKIGLDVYGEKVKAADAIKNDLDARYKAFAEAEAYLLSEALYLPNSMMPRNHRVTRGVPFTAPYSLAGIGKEKLKGFKLSETVTTKAEYEAAKAKWEAK